MRFPLLAFLPSWSASSCEGQQIQGTTSCKSPSNPPFARPEPAPNGVPEPCRWAQARLRLITLVHILLAVTVRSYLETRPRCPLLRCFKEVQGGSTQCEARLYIRPGQAKSPEVEGIPGGVRPLSSPPWKPIGGTLPRRPGICTSDTSTATTALTTPPIRPGSTVCGCFHQNEQSERFQKKKKKVGSFKKYLTRRGRS